jgi:uncharacterized protein
VVAAWVGRLASVSADGSGLTSEKVAGTVSPIPPSTQALLDTLEMPSLLARLQTDLNAARKGQDAARTLVLGSVLSDVKNRGIELRRDLTDEDVVDVLRRGIKRRRESIDAYTKGKRDDLAAKEAAEVRTLEEYLPAQVSEDEVRAAVRAAVAGGAANIGAVMGKVMPQFKGRADGGTISAIAREELARRG